MLGTAARLAIITSLAAAIGGSVEQDLRAKPDVAVLYIGAEDCAPCRVWRKDYWPSFVASSEFAHLTYREVVSPKLFDVLKDAYWPKDLRHYRRELGSSSAVPFWIVTVNGEVARTARGLDQWETGVLRPLRIFTR